MKIRRAALLASLCGVAATQVIAGTQTGLVKDVYIRDSDGLVLVNLSGTAALKPGCALRTYWIVPNEKSDSGKRLYAMLISAQLAGRPVTIKGKDTCTRWGDGEDIDSVDLSATQQ
jgi:hypothetical protein